MDIESMSLEELKAELQRATARAHAARGTLSQGLLALAKGKLSGADSARLVAEQKASTSELNRIIRAMKKFTTTK